MTVKLTLEKFATDCGVKIVDVGPGYGGRIGYTTKDYPNTTVGGFRTAEAAYRHWMEETFGKHAARQIIKLFKVTHPIKDQISYLKGVKAATVREEDRQMVESIVKTLGMFPHVVKKIGGQKESL